MKKILIILAALTISVSALSQEYKNAVGIRVGYDMAVTYKTFISNSNFLDLSVNIYPYHNHSGVLLGGYYTWNFSIAGADGLSWYVGPGIQLGTWKREYYHENGFYSSINVQAGIEYKIPSAPIALSVSYAPGFYVASSGNGFHLYSGGLGIKYTF